MTFHLLIPFIDNFVIFGILYVLGFSLVFGLSYMVPMHHGWLWFPNYPGLISGIILGGFGLGALIFSPVATALVNPEGFSPVDGKFPDSVNEKVPRMLLILDVCYLVMVVISSLMIFPGPDPTAFNDEVISKLEAPLPIEESDTFLQLGAMRAGTICKSSDSEEESTNSGNDNSGSLEDLHFNKKDLSHTSPPVRVTNTNVEDFLRTGQFRFEDEVGQKEDI